MAMLAVGKPMPLPRRAPSTTGPRREKGRPSRTDVRTGPDKNHFHPDYWPEGSKWQLPDLYRTDLAYANARRAFEANGRRIIDATVGGQCDIFPKVGFQEVLGSPVGSRTER